MRHLLLLCAWVCTCFGLVVLPAQAHQKNHALTTITAKPANQGLEVIHRFYVHDIEFAVKKHNESTTEFTHDKNAQQFFAQHVTDTFKLRLGDKQPLILSNIGYEIEGQYFWVYQELNNLVDVLKLEIRNKTLMDTFPEQQNLVNMDIDGKTKSISFEKGSHWQSFSF